MISEVRSFFPFSIASRVATPAPAFTFADLGTHPDGAPLLPVAVTDSGDLYVTARDPACASLVRAYRVTADGREPLGVACGQSPLHGVSSAGHAAGVTGNEVRALRAWASPLGDFGERRWPGAISFARGINARGQIVGNVLVDAGEFMLSRGYLLPQNGPARFLMPPHGGTTVAKAINDAGEIALNATPLGASLDDTRAWCLRENCYFSIPCLGGRRSSANALTPAGRIVGWSLTATGARHAFLWENGHTTDLAAGDDQNSEALAANDARTVVGRTLAPDGTPRAFRWTPGTGLRPLDAQVELPRGWRLREAVAINRHGVIAGVGMRRGKLRGFLLTPTAAS